MINPELEQTEPNQVSTPERPLLEKLWGYRENLLGTGFWVSFGLGHTLSMVSFGGSGREELPDLLNVGANLFKLSMSFGGLYLVARSVRWAASSYLGFLKDHHIRTDIWHHIQHK